MLRNRAAHIMGFPMYSQWAANPQLVSQAKQILPGRADLGELWHMHFMVTEPKNFWNAVIAHSNSLAADAAAQKTYNKTIATWASKQAHKSLLNNIAAAQDWGILDWTTIHLFPENWEWSNQYKILTDPNRYVDAVFQAYKQHSFPNDKAIEDFKKNQARMMVKYGGKDWMSKLTPDQAQRYATEFFPPAIAQASFSPGLPSEVSGKNMMIVGLVLAAAIGIPLIVGAFKKK